MCREKERWWGKTGSREQGAPWHAPPTASSAESATAAAPLAARSSRWLPSRAVLLQSTRRAHGREETPRRCCWWALAVKGRPRQGLGAKAAACIAMIDARDHATAAMAEATASSTHRAATAATVAGGGFLQNVSLFIDS